MTNIEMAKVGERLELDGTVYSAIEFTHDARFGYSFVLYPRSRTWDRVRPLANAKGEVKFWKTQDGAHKYANKNFLNAG